jgi:LDH2 family malate/lactate/ureidoglycolate dehydrogenase
MRVPAARLREFTRGVFGTLGMRDTDAEMLAEHLIWADLHGIAWLGVRKIPQYVARLRDGGTRADARPVVVADRPAFALIDGQHGWGQVMGVHAMRLAMAKARTTGVGAVVVRDTTSAGSLGYFASLAAAERLIGLAINNSPPLQPAWGGREKVIGNQAFAIASPAGRHDPVVLDMATSAITLARIHEYEAQGAPLPDGVALTAEGEPTADPSAALAGILLPMGGHRGYGIALMWEILTGVLAGGARFATDVTMPDRHEQPQAVSLFMLAVDPAAAMPADTFAARVDDLIDRIHASTPVPGVDRVRVPGERGTATASERARDGIPLPADLADRLDALGRDLGVPLTLSQEGVQ